MSVSSYELILKTIVLVEDFKAQTLGILRREWILDLCYLEAKGPSSESLRVKSIPDKQVVA